jgi:hypothetical protein
MATLITINKIEKTPLPTLKIAPELRELPPVSFAIAETEIQQAELRFSQAQRNLQMALSYDPFITAKANVDKARTISHKLRFVQVCQEREKKWSNS